MKNKEIEELMTQFWEEYQKELKQFPYQINLLDIVRNGHNSNVNEDAHSRILVNLLQYEQNGKFPILESFVNNCLGFYFKNIVDPQVTYHNDYIDVLIEIGNKAIIIENKINEARDQNKQLERYIAATKEKHSDIYAVYLTREGGEPDENSLSSENKEELMSQDRYRSINYREDIILWLTENVLPQIVYKEKPLINSLIIYEDYLEGLFNLRETETNIITQTLSKMKIFENNTPAGKIEKIESIIEYLRKEQIAIKLKDMAETIKNDKRTITYYCIGKNGRCNEDKEFHLGNIQKITSTKYLLVGYTYKEKRICIELENSEWIRLGIRRIKRDLNKRNSSKDSNDWWEKVEEIEDISDINQQLKVFEEKVEREN